MKKLRDYIYNEISILKRSVTLPEYIWWWITRICMAVMIIHESSQDREPMVILLMELNLSMTFIIPFIRFICFPKLFLGNLPFRAQSFIDIFVMFGSFLGHGFDFNGTVAGYDKLMHLISGGLVVFIGYLIINGLETGKKLSPGLKTFAAAGFSNVVIIVWELFEFFSDYFIKDSRNQNWFYDPNGDIFPFRLFTSSAAAPAQYPVLDTDLDILSAAIGILLCCIPLYFYVKKRSRVTEKELCIQTEKNS